MSTNDLFSTQSKPLELRKKRDIPRPRVLQYYPKNGSEGMPFTVVLQFCPNELLKLGFGTYIVQDTKQWNAHGYTTLSCLVPELTVTKWFESKVPVCILAVEDDVVLDSWYFGEYTFSQMNFMKPTDLFPDESSNQLSDIIENTQIEGSCITSLNQGEEDRLDFLNGNVPFSTSSISSGDLIQIENDPFNLNDEPSMMHVYNDMDDTSNIFNTQDISCHTEAQYMQYSFSRTGFMNSSLRQATEVDVEIDFNVKSDESHNQDENEPNLGDEGLGNNSSSALPLVSYNGYSPLVKKASLIFKGHLEDMMKDWTSEENKYKRRLVQFWRSYQDSAIQCSFESVTLADLPPNSIVVSCIYWEQKDDYYITSVDCIYLLESLIAVRFTVEEKNRIRRNLEGFRPLTISKCKQECADFFKLIMSFPNPKPRNIEKDVKVFPWKILPDALRKIVSKYTASYSSTDSMNLDAFHNTFPPTFTQNSRSPRPSVANHSYLGSSIQGSHNISDSVPGTSSYKEDSYSPGTTSGQLQTSYPKNAQRRRLYLRRHSLMDPYALPYSQPRRHSVADFGSINQHDTSLRINPMVPLKIPRYSSSYAVETPETGLRSNLSPQFTKPDPIWELSRVSMEDSEGISPLALTQESTYDGGFPHSIDQVPSANLHSEGSQLHRLEMGLTDFNRDRSTQS